MSYVLDRKLTIPSWGIAIFAVALMAPMPATPVLAVLLFAALLVTMRDGKESPQTLVMVAAARADAPVSLAVRRAHAADLARMDDDGGRQKSRRMTSISSTSSRPARRSSTKPNDDTAVTEPRAPRPPVIIPGDVLVSRSTARADVYDISVVPRDAHIGKTRYQDAMDAGRLLARGLAVDGWFSCDHTHYVRIATFRI
jgi:hypothetical protein